jgi:hypothetical protein
MEGIKLDGLEGLGKDLPILPSDPEGHLGGADPRALEWEAGQLPPPEDVAFSLQQLCAASGEGLEVLERIAKAGERIASALEGLRTEAAKASAALGA